MEWVYGCEQFLPFVVAQGWPPYVLAMEWRDGNALVFKEAGGRNCGSINRQVVLFRSSSSVSIASYWCLQCADYGINLGLIADIQSPDDLEGAKLELQQYVVTIPCFALVESKKIYECSFRRKSIRSILQKQSQKISKILRRTFRVSPKILWPTSRNKSRNLQKMRKGSRRKSSNFKKQLPSSFYHSLLMGEFLSPFLRRLNVEVQCDMPPRKITLIQNLALLPRL